MVILMPKSGTVYLVGAGPGDPGLITIKGLKCLQDSDVVIYDRLVDPQMLKHVRPDSEVIYAGKSAGDHTMTQEEINFLLVSKAKEGKSVCRLKGGDPFVFGRGGEEAEALAKEGLPFEVVPGITSAIAAPAYAGIPVTHRGLTSSFAVITGHEDPTKEEGQLSWDALAKMGTLVCLMGVENLPNIVSKLLEHGRSPDTPAALVQWGTWPKQRVVEGTLKDIVQRAKEAKLGPPAVTIIGEVAALRGKINWFDNKPLFGKRVLVTRSREQASKLSEQLSELGAEAVEVPAIHIEEPDDYGPLDEAVANIQRYGWIVFTSVNGVDGFFRRLHAQGKDARALASTKICAVGPAVASALKELGIIVDLLPKEYLTSAVVAALGEGGIAGTRVLLPRTDITGEDMAGGLEALGATVDQVVAYRTVASKELPDDLVEDLHKGNIDIITFASSSTVRNLVSLLNGDLSLLSKAKIASIGPITSKTAQELGLNVDIEAEEHTIPGLVQAIVQRIPEVQPDDLQKLIVGARAQKATGAKLAHDEFNKALENLLKEHTPSFPGTIRNRPSSEYLFITVGRPTFHLHPRFASGSFRVELHIESQGKDKDRLNRAGFEALLQEKMNIEAALGEALEWDGTTFRIFTVRQNVSISSSSEVLHDLMLWAASELFKFWQVFEPRIKALNLTPQ